MTQAGPEPGQEPTVLTGRKPPLPGNLGNWCWLEWKHKHCSLQGKRRNKATVLGTVTDLPLCQ